MKKIGSFTGLRFLFIMVIVICHFEFLRELQPFGDFYQKYIHNATLAVDFFFMLSGFGMMFSSQNSPRPADDKCPSAADCLRYGIKHIRKIYPVYIATICFGLACNIAIIFIKSKPVAQSGQPHYNHI